MRTHRQQQNKLYPQRFDFSLSKFIYLFILLLIWYIILEYIVIYIYIIGLNIHKTYMFPSMSLLLIYLKMMTDKSRESYIKNNK